MFHWKSKRESTGIASHLRIHQPAHHSKGLRVKKAKQKLENSPSRVKIFSAMARGSEAKALEQGSGKDDSVKRVAKYTVGFVKKGESEVV